MKLEGIVKLFRDRLFAAFYEWLDTNKSVIGKWYDGLYKRAKDGENIADDAIGIMATAMWMFNMIADCGVLAGIGPDRVDLQVLAEGLDRQSTMRLLNLISACMNLQYLPRDIAKQKIPIISSKKFSLKLFTQRGTNDGR